MAARPKPSIWRKVFLRALARTGNVRAAAAEAGINTETAYNHRARDPAFATAWAGAAAKGKAVAAKDKARRVKGAGELVLRRTKHGDQLVRAGAGRWNRRAEDVFFAALERTACVRHAAAACGFSTNALYARRAAYPEFAEKWDRVLAAAKAQIPDLLAAATIASLDPEAAVPRRGLGRLPKVNVDQAIRISRIETGADGPRGRGERHRKPLPSAAEVDAELVKLLKMLRKRKLKEGWVETPEGQMIPPGWVYVGVKATDDAAPD